MSRLPLLCDPVVRCRACVQGEVLPPNWTKEFDPSNDAYYYFNSVTGESSWDLPTA